MSVTVRAEPSRHVAPQLPVILALVPSRGDQSRIRESVRGRAAVVAVDDVSAFIAHLKATSDAPAMLIVEATDGHGTPTAPFVREIIQSLPGVPVVGYCRVESGHSREIIDLAAAGVHEILFHGVDDAGVSLRAVLDSARQACASAEIVSALRAFMPSAGIPLFRYCLDYPHRATSVEAVADALGIHRKTLVNRCTQARLPAPSAVLSWARLLLAAYFLGNPHRTVEAIAMQLDYPSATSLRNMLKRYTGLRPQDVRALGGVTPVLTALADSLRN
jgi:AraC-like DNA-binding protein